MEVSEEERLKTCRDIAAQMYAAGLGDCYDALERLTRPRLDMQKVAEFVAAQMWQPFPEPSPYERGILDRYQDKRHGYAARKRGGRHK